MKEISNKEAKKIAAYLLVGGFLIVATAAALCRQWCFVLLFAIWGTAVILNDK